MSPLRDVHVALSNGGGFGARQKWGASTPAWVALSTGRAFAEQRCGGASFPALTSYAPGTLMGMEWTT